MSTTGEKRLLSKGPSGWVDLSDLPDDQRLVDPMLIRRLCVGPEAEQGDSTVLHIRGAIIAKPLDLTFCTVSKPLHFYQATFLKALQFGRCRIPALDFDDCDLKAGIQAGSIHVDYTLSFESSRICGTADLIGARIGADLICSGATFVNQNASAPGEDQGWPIALRVYAAEIGANMTLNRGFTAIGEVRLTGSKIGANLDCSRATLKNDGGRALVADRAEIAIGVLLTESKATGEVSLMAAKVGTDLDCSGATLANEGRDALSVDGAEIGGNVTLDYGFSATGAIRFNGALVGGSLICRNATLSNQGGPVLVLTGTKITMSLVLDDTQLGGRVRLFETSTTMLQDDLGKGDCCGSWIGAKGLVLSGFSYKQFAETDSSDSSDPWDHKRRFRWLKRTEEHDPGAWEQLIEVYRTHGREADARRAAIAKENDRLARANLLWPRKLGRFVLRVTVSHGYRPWLVTLWAIPVILIFAFVVWTAPELFLPTVNAPARSPQPIVYAADTFLPVIDFGEAGKWVASGWVQWVQWAVILLGWTLSTIFVAGYTKIVRT